jgi:hypothetical protein|tara:strand:+ start:1839 stop:3800 length:1962 start_codon:yes stop_codon:yes gene_type:complete
MTIEDKQTLKSFFESGDTPTQAQFAILIDSLLGIEEEIADNLTTDSNVQALSARQGVALKALVDAMGLRVSSIEELNDTTLQDYLLSADLGGFLAGKTDVGHTHLASNITDLLDVVYSQSEVDALIANYSVDSHGHEISDISGLQAALDNSNDASLIASTRSDLENQILGKANATHTHTESDITDLKNYLESATATILLQGKAEASHTHNESQITDLDKYTKAEVDSLFAGVVSDGSVPAHTHTESDITDLDKYTKAEVDQKITDGSTTGLQSHIDATNPHGVTKADVGLGDVENLSREGILNDATLNNPTFTGTIVGLNGSAVGLPNVPNVNVLDLLNTHLADTANPHEVELADFDAFTRAETEAKIQELLEIFRTVHVGSLPSSGTGSTGLITQKDIYDRLSSIESGATQIGDDLTINGGLKVDGPIEDTDGNLELKGKDGSLVHVQDELKVDGNTTIGATDGPANLTVYGTIQPNNTVKALTGDLILEGKNGDDVQVNDDLKVAGNVTATDGDLTLAGKDGAKVTVDDNLSVTGHANLKGTTIGTSSANSDLSVNGNTTISGNLTVNGTTTSIDTTNLEIEDNMVVLNKNQTGNPASNLQSGIEVERGDKGNARLFFDETTGRWKAEIVSGNTVVIKTIAFVEDSYSQQG